MRDESALEYLQDQPANGEDEDEDGKALNVIATTFPNNAPDVEENFHDAVEEQEDAEDHAEDEEDELDDDEDAGAFQDAVADDSNEGDKGMRTHGALDQRQNSASSQTLNEDEPESEEETTCCWQSMSAPRHTSPSNHSDQGSCSSDSGSAPIDIQVADGNNETDEGTCATRVMRDVLLSIHLVRRSDVTSTDKMSTMQGDNASQSSSVNIHCESHPHTLDDVSLPQRESPCSTLAFPPLNSDASIAVSEMDDATSSTPHEGSTANPRVISTSPPSFSTPVCALPRAGGPPLGTLESTVDDDPEDDTTPALDVIRLVLQAAYPANPRAGLPLLSTYARCVIEHLQAGNTQLPWNRRRIPLWSSRKLTRPPPDRRSQLTAGLCLRPYQVQRPSQRPCSKYPTPWTGSVRTKSSRALQLAQSAPTIKSTALALSCAQEARMGMPPVLAEVAPVASGPRSTDTPRWPGGVVTTSGSRGGDYSLSLPNDSHSSRDAVDVPADAAISAVQSPPSAPAVPSISNVDLASSAPSAQPIHPSLPSLSSAPPSVPLPIAPISTSPPAPQLPETSGAPPAPPFTVSLSVLPRVCRC